MTVSDLIVLAPWIVFGAGLVVIFFRLRRTRRRPRRLRVPAGEQGSPVWRMWR